MRIAELIMTDKQKRQEAMAASQATSQSAEAKRANLNNSDGAMKINRISRCICAILQCFVFSPMVQGVCSAVWRQSPNQS